MVLAEGHPKIAAIFRHTRNLQAVKVVGRVLSGLIFYSTLCFLAKLASAA